MALGMGQLALGLLMAWTVDFAGVLATNAPLVKAEQSSAKPAVAAKEPAKKADDKPAAKTGEQKKSDSDTPPGKDAGKTAAAAASGGKKAEPAKSGQPAEKDKAAASAPATHTVKKSPLRVTLDLDGAFEAQTSHEIVVKPEEWSSLVIETVVPHGAQVRKGDVLLTLDLEKIDRALDDLRNEQKLAVLSIRQAEDQLRALEKLTPLDLETSTRAATVAQEDRKFFTDIDKPFAVKATQFGLKVAKEALEYEEEELHQLEKMYKADDITEETEQIVLKRARDTVERAKFMVDAYQLQHDQILKFSIPRAEDRVKESASRRSIDLEKSKVQLPLAVERQRLELARLRVQFERSADRLKKLQADREGMVVKSPIDGIVYYGKATRGRFGDATSMGESLRRNGSIMPNQVVMTIVQPRPMFIRASVPEGELHHVRPTLKGVATPTASPDLKLAATVDRVSDVPTGPGSFDARLNVALDRKAKFLMPGMGCKVKLVPYLRKEAITVPPKVVGAEELDEQKKFVWVVGKDGKPQKRPVTLGERTDKQVEILTGLSEGEKVLLEPPKEQT